MIKNHYMTLAEGATHPIIVRYAQTDLDKAVALLADRMIDMMRDRLFEDDDKGEVLNTAIDAINLTPGPSIMRGIMDNARQHLTELRYS